MSEAGSARSGGLVGKLVLSVGLAVLFLGIAARGIVAELDGGWSALGRELGRALGAVGWVDVGVYALLFLVVHAARVVRWVLQVQPLGETDRGMVLRVCVIGYAAIVLFPLRLGELVRPFLLARESRTVGFPAAMGTAVTERVLDGLVITGLLFAAVMTAPIEPAPVVVAAGWASATVFCSATVGLVLFVTQRSLAVRLLHATVGRVTAGGARRIESMMGAFIDGLRTLGSAGTLLPFVGWTVVYWGVNALGIWWLARGFGLDLPLHAGLGLLSVLVVGIMIPAGPGFLGNFQLFLGRGLELYLPPSEIQVQGLAFALTMNVVQLVLQVGVAVPFLAMTGMGVRRLLAVQREASEMAAAADGDSAGDAAGGEVDPGERG
jgi:uncharacterized membrane protein YbhN (UPF0104 family)